MLVLENTASILRKRIEYEYEYEYHFIEYEYEEERKPTGRNCKSRDLAIDTDAAPLITSGRTGDVLR